jgi:hypothetical protein
MVNASSGDCSRDGTALLFVGPYNDFPSVGGTAVSGDAGRSHVNFPCPWGSRGQALPSGSRARSLSALIGLEGFLYPPRLAEHQPIQFPREAETGNLNPGEGFRSREGPMNSISKRNMWIAALQPKVQEMATLSRIGHAHLDSKGQVCPASTCMLFVINDVPRLLALAVKGQGVCTLRGMAHLKQN